MAKDSKLGIVISPEFRAAHTNLFEPVAFKDPKTQKPKGDPVYSFLAMFAKDGADITELKQKAKAVAVAEWGAEGLAGVKWPFKDGDAEANRILEKAKSGGKEKSEDQVKYLRGNILLKCKSAFPPKVGDNKGDEIIDKSKVYSGSYGRAELNFKAQTISDPDGDKKYVTAYFNFYMKTRDGERLAGRDFKTVFKGLLGGESNADPTADIDID
jgi:hypothetical protein